jgi:uncharacterized protein
MTTRVILQIDGGGILGITPSIVLDELEKVLRQQSGKPDFLLRDILSLSCGTSTGAIMAGLVSAGVGAAHIRKFYEVDGIDLFDNGKNSIFTRLLQPKFKRQPFIDKLNEILSGFSAHRKAELSLGELPGSLMLMTTAYNLCSHRTHFIKSTDPHDQGLALRDVIAWSALSAAYYFGKINVPGYTWKLYDNQTPSVAKPVTGAVFQDGGQGTQNCTLDFVLTEILSRDWGSDDGKIVIISLGTGGRTQFEPFDSAKNISDVGQALKFVANQARAESTTVQKLAASYVAAKRPNIKVYRLDYETLEDYSLDDTAHARVYAEGAKGIIAGTPFQDLLKDLAGVI